MIAAIIVFVLAADLLSKYIIAGDPALQNITVIPGFFHITYAENTGMAWSLMSGQTAFLALISAAAVGGMLWYLLTKHPDKLTSAALALMIGGAAGNLFDRLLLGYVRDFLDFYIFGYDFPVFNIADCYVTIGFFVTVILILFVYKEEDLEVLSFKKTR